jgi:phosphohistidine phosphatase
MDLFVLRHGEAGARLEIAAKDSGRSLTATGREEVQIIAERISNLKLKFDHIVTSPLPRARETALIVAKIQKVKADEWDELKPEGDRQAFYRRLSKLKTNSSVLVVGHEPYLTTMICDVVGAPGGRILLKKGGLARVRVTALTPKVVGELRWLLSPRVIKKL